MKLNLDTPHREAADIILQVRRLDLAFAELQTAWDEFRRISNWTARDRRIYDYCGNFVATADDAPTIYRFITQEDDNRLAVQEGHDLPYMVVRE